MADGSIVRCPACGAGNRVRPTSSGVPRCGKCQAMLPWLVDATPETFSAEVRASVPVVVDFWAAWCGPCRMIAPVLESIATKHAGHVKIVKVDVDRYPQLGQQFSAQSIPLLVRFADGKEADRVVGALPPQQLEAWLAPHLA